MSATVSLIETQIFTAVVTVLGTMGLASSTAGQPVPIVRGQVNRVPEPSQSDFVVLWPISRDRLATNIDSWVDNQVVGSIADNILNVSTILVGAVSPGQPIFGLGVSPGCQVGTQFAGDIGSVGLYQTTPSAPVAPTTLYIGTRDALQKTEVTIQADVHGPAAADNTARITTLWRDEFGVNAFAATGADVAPLYTSDPRQLSFENGEQQTEERWSIDLCMQANIIITTSMQFADQLVATPISVDAAYPA